MAQLENTLEQTTCALASFKWPEVFFRDCNLCVISSCEGFHTSRVWVKCEWQTCWRGTVTFSLWTVTQSELKAWHRNPVWQETAWPHHSANAFTNGRDRTVLISLRKTMPSTASSLRMRDKPVFCDSLQNVCPGWQVHRLPALRLQIH